MKKITVLIACLVSLSSFGKQLNDYFPQGHSHNDYLQPAPFTLA
ncbi:hypothetical protein [Dyadobacter crusticola]|nr:hypothetical protein [Dyadobacter crusticola]